MGVHDGHRERMRERFLQHGLENFNEIEALEFLLFYAIPQRDTNPLAHALLDRFGTLSDVLNATEQQLCEVAGVGARTAALLMLIPQMYRLSEVKKAQRIGQINSTGDAISFFRPYFEGKKDEMLMLACLDSTGKVISAEIMSTGVVNGVRFDKRQLIETALKRKASAVMIAHNHPDGQPYPSHEDDEATTELYHALRTFDIMLYDHVILAGEKEYSYRRNGTLEICAYHPLY